jgi:hypothetical protein
MGKWLAAFDALSAESAHDKIDNDDKTRFVNSVAIVTGADRQQSGFSPAMPRKLEHGGADLIELFQERAAIRQYDGRWPRHLAERLAHAEVVEAWCRQNPPVLAAGLCGGCQRSLTGQTLDLPDGARVHFDDDRFECLIAYGSSRTARAIAALAELGLLPPEGYGG